MKNKIITSFMNFICKYNNVDDYKYDLIKYGFEGLYLTLTKLVLIIFVNIILGQIKEFFLLSLFFNIIRFFAFGVHAKRSRDCLISSLILFVLFPYLIKVLSISNIILIPIFLVLSLIIIIYSPSDTVKRPITKKDKRITYKILTTLVLITYLVFLSRFNNNSICNSIFFAGVIQSFIVLPITYKLFGVPYKNKEVNN